MPKAEDWGMGFVTVDDDLKLRFEEAVHQGDDDVKGEDNKVSLLGSPLEVVFWTDLNGGGMSEGGGDNQFVVRYVE